MVNNEIDSGKRLIMALESHGFEVRIAFWAKPTDEDKWYLYLASPFVDEKGGAAAYDLIIGVVRKETDLAIDRSAVRAIRLDDSLTTAALRVLTAKASNGPFAAGNSKPNPGMTRLYASTLGGLSIDGALIYPQSEPSVSA